MSVLVGAFATTVVVLAAACQGGWKADYQWQTEINDLVVYSKQAPWRRDGKTCFSSGVISREGQSRGEGFQYQLCVTGETEPVVTRNKEYR